MSLPPPDLPPRSAESRRRNQGAPDQHRGGGRNQVNDTRRPRQSKRARRAVAAVCAPLVRLRQSRGLFAVIGAGAATIVFVLFSWLPGSDLPALSLPAIADHVGSADAEADTGTGAGNGAAQASQGRLPEPGRSSAPLPIPQAPFAGTAPAAPAPGEPAPAQQAQPAPGEPAEPTPRTPPGPPIFQQDKRVVLSTKAGREFVEIDWWQKSSSEAADLRMDPDGIYTTMGAQLSVVDGLNHTITYPDCAQRANWVTRVGFATLHQGSTICARSRTGNYAALTVIALPPSTRNHDKFVFQGTTWQLPGQPAPRQLPPTQTPYAQTPSGQPTSPRPDSG